MSKIIRLRKALDIKLMGEAEQNITSLNINEYALKPTCFTGIKPKLAVNEGDLVKAGSVIFYSKDNEKIVFTSPVSGTVTEIKRGEKRVIEEIKIKADSDLQFIDFGKEDVNTLNKEQVTEKMLAVGLWPFLRQRPYSVIANPTETPKCIVVSAFDSAPLAPDYNLMVNGRENEFQAGLTALSKLTDKVYLNLHATKSKSTAFINAKNVEITYFQGKHPAGNISVQTHHLNPINKGEVIWYMNAQDVITLGCLFLQGHYNAKRIIAVTGSEANKPQYYKVIAGCNIAEIVNEQVSNKEKVRCISGNALTGTKIQANGYLGAYSHQLTFLPEGDYYEFLGWANPGFKKYSFSKTFLSSLLPKKAYKLDTNLHGGNRALVVTGEFEKVLPMDILPMNLIKACIIKDIDLMEQLGIYEVDAEDFALCEFIDTSKTEIQSIIRDSLEWLRKENG